MDTIEGIRTFVAVAGEGSFTRAAERLNISTKLTSKYIRQLEDRLGVQLFNRTTRSVSLTDIGAVYLRRCRPLLDQFDELEDLVQDRQKTLRGNIRITAPTGFGSVKLTPAIEPFLRHYPDVTIDLHLTDRTVAIVEEGFDLAIRVGVLEDSALIARRLASMRGVVVATPAYLAKHGRPAIPDDLTQHNCILNTRRSDPAAWQFRVDGALKTVHVSGSFQANAPKAVAEMVLKDAGIALSPMYVVEDNLKRGELDIVLEGFEAITYGVYALYPRNRHLTARIRGLIDHLAREFAER